VNLRQMENVLSVCFFLCMLLFLSLFVSFRFVCSVLFCFVWLSFLFFFFLLFPSLFFSFLVFSFLLFSFLLFSSLFCSYLAFSFLFFSFGFCFLFSFLFFTPLSSYSTNRPSHLSSLPSKNILFLLHPFDPYFNKSSGWPLHGQNDAVSHRPIPLQKAVKNLLFLVHYDTCTNETINWRWPTILSSKSTSQMICFNPGTNKPKSR
jgi:hypothetical protein